MAVRRVVVVAALAVGVLIAGTPPAMAHSYCVTVTITAVNPPQTYEACVPVPCD